VLLSRTKATAESKVSQTRAVAESESEEGKQRTVLLSQTKAAAESKVSRMRAVAESVEGKQHCEYQVNLVY
jgi:hypothetical protein